MKQQEETNNKYFPDQIEQKWQKTWEDKKIFSADIKGAKNPYFNLMMFPYPSAEGLHVGNMYAFTGADVYARYNRMLGKDVLEPIGLDGFGIHSENYALKIGRHPMAQAEIAEKNFYRQMRSIGNSFDWQRTVETYDPNYYKWTQWLFIVMFENGLAYRKTALVNWCPKDLTVLSDEQVIPASPGESQGGDGGVCERCGAKVEKRDLEQWFFRITGYADRLLNNIEGLAWSEKVKIAQRNWIGKSEGAEIGFRVEGLGDSYELKVYTTRPDTLFGATFMVLSPEHEIVQKLGAGSWELGEDKQEEVADYLEKAKNKTEIERTGEGKDKTGVFSGLYAINPVNNKEIPIWIADYVLSGYGTGAIMAVPAHDTRDYEFAKKYDLEVIPVIESPATNHQSQELPYVGPGKLINSGAWDGIEVPKDMSKILDSLEDQKLGLRKANFHLRDWLISRQRYWGPPIPMIYCKACFEAKKGKISDMPGWYAVADHDLPVLLPDVADWKPDPLAGSGQVAKGPLANHPEFYKTTCPSCGADAERETDVSDTFLDSSWYFLRYPSTDIENNAFDIETTKKWLPVNQYIGGAEHSVLHLLYARFVTMVLCDLKFIDFEEPFAKFFAHGLIIKDGAKMSKSKGNVVVPDEYIAKYGADTLRSYLMFIGPYSDGGDFRDSGIEGMYKFLKKVWHLLQKSISNSELQISNEIPNEQIAKLDQKMHQTIKDVSDDIVQFKFNTAIARLMEYYNVLNEFYIKYQILNTKYCESFLLLLAPFAPHMTEELFQGTGDRAKGVDFRSIHLSQWPEYDEKYLVSDTVVVPVQINGKRRAEIEIGSQELGDGSLVERMAKEAVASYLEGIEVRKVIYVTGKIINLVV